MTIKDSNDACNDTVLNNEGNPSKASKMTEALTISTNQPQR